MSEKVRENFDDWALSRRGIDPDKAAEFDTWLNSIKADAWDEGFDAGEMDVMQHEQHDWANACIVNPYRIGGNNV